VPEDALHADCADGQNVFRYGVLQMLASEAEYQEKAVSGALFNIAPVHRPLPSCYAHSEIHCTRLIGPDPIQVEDCAGTISDNPSTVKIANLKDGAILGAIARQP